MRRVVWRRLVLRGFGCYRTQKELELREGLNVYVAGNEEGKSTLVAGLVAVLYGLPGSSDPARYGKARYYNWDGPGEFSGELEFTVDGRQYHLRRDFLSDRVSLVRREGTRVVELAGGGHRARARRPNLTYLEALSGLISISTPELFTSTFCLTQPLVCNTALDNDVLRLLTGADSSYQEALNLLAARLKGLVRCTGDLGVTPRNQQSDKRLERLQREIDELRESLEHHREVLDALPVVQADLARRLQERQQVVARLREREAALRSWGEWRAYRARYHAILTEQSRLEQVLERAAALAGQELGLSEELQTTYPELVGCPAETGATLGLLRELVGWIGDREAEVAELTANLKARGEQVEKLETRLQNEFAAIIGRPEVLQKHQKLMVLLRQKEDLEGRLARASQAEAEARARMGALWDWGQLGQNPSALLGERRHLVRALLEEWQDYLRDSAEVSALDRILTGELSWFEQAPPEALEACRDYLIRKGQLARQREQAEAALRQAEAVLQEHERAWQAWRQEFGVLAEMGEGAARAVEDKLIALNQIKRLTQEAAPSGPKAAANPLWLWVSALTGALLLFAASLWFWPLGLGLGLAAALWLWLRREREQEKRRAVLSYEQRLAQADTSLRDLEARHPFLKDWGEAELIRAQERWRHCQAVRETLEVQASLVPTEEEVAALEAELDRARRMEEHLDGTVREVRHSFPDPSQAFYRWQQARRRREELAARLGAWAQREFGPGTVEVRGCSLHLAAERWRAVATLGAITGVTLRTVGELIDWLESLDDAWWQKALRQAEMWEEAAAGLSTARAILAEAGERGEGGPGSLKQLQVAIDKLRRELSPLDEHTGSEELRHQVEEYQKLKTELEALKRLHREETARLARLRDELGSRKAERDAVASVLAPLLVAAGGDVERALECWQAFQQLSERRSGTAMTLAATLKGQGVDSLEELRLRALDAAHQANQVLADWNRLVELNPGLPDVGLGEMEDEVYNSLKEEVDSLVAQLQRNDTALEELHARQRVLLAAAPPNLAAGRDQLAELCMERQQLELEVEALSLAYRELERAAQEFQTSHREHLARRAGEYFAMLSGVSSRRVEIDENFRIGLALDTGRAISVSQLSQGAQDQLYLSLRLAIADLLSRDLILPFILDDPFLNFDDHRLGSARLAVQRLSKERQVLLLSHRTEFLHWLDRTPSG